MKQLAIAGITIVIAGTLGGQVIALTGSHLLGAAVAFIVGAGISYFLTEYVS